MYRIFAMGVSGRLYQLGSLGWIVRDGTNFPKLFDVRVFLEGSIIPAVPFEKVIVDGYIARVGPDGLIEKTFPLQVQANGYKD